MLQQLEDLSPVTMGNYLSDLRQFMAWCEESWHKEQEDRAFTPRAVALVLLMRYRDYLQATLGLKPSTVNRTLLSLKRYFAWARKTHITLLLHTGLRAQELCTLTRQQVHLGKSVVPLHRLAQVMGHDSLDTTMLYIRGTK